VLGELRAALAAGARVARQPEAPADGKRCGSTWRLELDHVIPVALGGETSVENLRVLCRAHNQYKAERVLGATHADTAT
jgi:hypothetical protein